MERAIGTRDSNLWIVFASWLVRWQKTASTSVAERKLDLLFVVRFMDLATIHSSMPFRVAF